MASLIALPQCIDDGRIDLILKILGLSKKQGSNPLRFRWSKTESVSPAGLGILCCLLDTFIEQGNTVTHIKVGKKLKALTPVRHLLASGRLQTLPPPDTYNYEDETTILRGITNAIDPSFVERVQEKFFHLLSEDLRYASALILNELMQNSVDHSSAERCYLYAGLWHREFHVGVLDMGITIPAKMEQKYQCESDLDYLELALKKGTGTRRIRTGGFGLYYFFEFLKECHGKLTIVSRGAQIRRYFRTRRSQKNTLKYPLYGTWCFARMPLESDR